MTHKIEEQFKSYREKVVPKEASEAQIIETQRAFYAGAAAMLTFFHTIGESAGTELDGVVAIEETTQELRRFALSVEQGGN